MFVTSQRRATLAQLAEHPFRNRKVVGSIPTGGSGWEAGERNFLLSFSLFLRLVVELWYDYVIEDEL